MLSFFYNKNLKVNILSKLNLKKLYLDLKAVYFFIILSVLVINLLIPAPFSRRLIPSLRLIYVTLLKGIFIFNLELY